MASLVCRGHREIIHIEGYPLKWFFGLIQPSCIESQDLNKFSCRTIINRDIHSFVPFYVLGEYSKSLFASASCMHIFFPRTLRIWLILFACVRRRFCVPQTTLHLPYFPRTLKYLSRILQIYLDTFR